MANTGFKGIDVRQTGSLLHFRFLLQTSAGALVTTGTTVIYIYEHQSDGTIKTYDFNDNTFKTTACTTPTLALTYRKSNNATVDTGLWTGVLATLTAFTVGAVYEVHCNNSGAYPTDQTREFQYGSEQGDVGVWASGTTGLGYVQSDLKAIDEQLTNGNNATLYLKQLNVVNPGGDAIVASSTGSNGNGVNASGNGTADGIKATGGATGRGVHALGGATSGAGFRAEAQGGNSHGLHALGFGSGNGVECDAGATGNGVLITGGSTSGAGLSVTTTSGDGVSVTPTAGHAITAAANGTSKHGLNVTGGTAGTSDGLHAAAGTGGVDIRGNIAGSLTGTVQVDATVGWGGSPLPATYTPTQILSQAVPGAFTAGQAGYALGNTYSLLAAFLGAFFSTTVISASSPSVFIVSFGGTAPPTAAFSNGRVWAKNLTSGRAPETDAIASAATVGGHTDQLQITLASGFGLQPQAGDTILIG